MHFDFFEARCRDLKLILSYWKMAKVRLEVVVSASGGALGLDISQGLRAIYGGFAGAQQIEVGTVKDKNSFHNYLVFSRDISLGGVT